jgi:ferrous iron transport protein A
MAPVVPLHCLTPGTSAEVVCVVGTCELACRLREMGLCQGARLGLVQAGTPCIVTLGNQRLCIRTTGDCQILVQPLESVVT